MSRFFITCEIGEYELFFRFVNGLASYNCTCPDFTFRQVHKIPVGFCKHIKMMLNLIEEESKNATNKLEEKQ